MGREKAGVVPIKIVSCWSDSGEAVGGVFGIFRIFLVDLWDGTGLNNRTGLDKTVSSCGNTGAARVFVVRANTNSSSSGILVLARYGCCCCTSVGMTIMRTEAGMLLLLLWSGMSIPGVLFAIPWLVLLWHALGLVGGSFRFCFYRISTKLVRGDVPLLFVVAKIGAWCCFLRRMVVRMGSIS